MKNHMLIPSLLSEKIKGKKKGKKERKNGEMRGQGFNLLVFPVPLYLILPKKKGKKERGKKRDKVSKDLSGQDVPNGRTE